MDATARDLVDTFIDAATKLELDPRTDSLKRRGATRFSVFPHGRADTPLTRELFLIDLSVDEGLAQARAIAADEPHMITCFGDRVRADIATYEANGYEPNGEWTLMVRPLGEPVSLPGDERAQRIDDQVTGNRVVSAIVALGGTGHPIRSGHHADPAIREYWMPVDGEPASYGLAVVLGERAYLGEMMTFPAFRRRGFATAILRRLLDDALAAGARECVLVSTAMGEGLYRGMGFRDVLPFFAFRTRTPRSA